MKYIKLDPLQINNLGSYNGRFINDAQKKNYVFPILNNTEEGYLRLQTDETPIGFWTYEKKGTDEIFDTNTINIKLDDDLFVL